MVIEGQKEKHMRHREALVVGTTASACVVGAGRTEVASRCGGESIVHAVMVAATAIRT